MDKFISSYEGQIVSSAVVIFVFICIRFFSKALIRKLGQKNGINEARTLLISRYTTVTLLLLLIMIELFIFGANANDLVVVFSSIFAVIGIALFAIWSILSNVTSGIIMFFSFPYKVGDKIKIHDNDFPLEVVIEDIRAFQLHLRTDEGNLITYPNNLILQKPVTLIQKNAINNLNGDNSVKKNDQS